MTSGWSRPSPAGWWSCGTARWSRKARPRSCSPTRGANIPARCSRPPSIWKRRRKASWRSERVKLAPPGERRVAIVAGAPGAVLVIVAGATQDAWYGHFRAARGARDLRFWPQAIGDPVDVGYACVWRAPHGLLAELPNLKAIFNLGAGVDHLLADPGLPDLPIARAVHPDLSMRMTEYVVLHTLLHHRRQRLYDAQQRARVWQGHDQPAASE